MSNRRAPLANNPNAANSPYRGAVSRQKRSYATVQREDAYGQPPPAKKQMLDSQTALRTPPRHYSTQSLAEGRVFTKTSSTSQQTAFERKLVAVRDKPAQQLVVKAERKSEENLESIRQWQRHHRKIFPTFVFYFESIPEDARVKYTKQVNALGAREEKFFSNAVTHVVTTRAIPPEHVTSPTEAVVQSSTTNESNSQNSQPQTINPSLLDRSSESTQLQTESFGTRGKFTFDAQTGRKVASHSHDTEARRHARNADVLCRARELGMKIWALEKLQRMMTTMFDTDTGYQALHGHNTRSHSVQGAASIPRTTTELSQLLRNERINGPSDRDLTVSTKEITVFKGPFIYIHDIDEKQKPIMVREYAKVANKEDGDWPQFRSVPNGKCPFVEEVDCGRREVDREKELVRRQKEKEQTVAPRTRAATAAVEASRMQPPKTATSKRALVEVGGGSNRNVTVSTNEADPFTSSKVASHRTDRVSSRGNQNAFVSRAGVGRLFGGEPVASGLQASNITSAIRSQMISSTAAQPGAKAGTSKEVHGLQRKILEKNSGGPGSHGLASSHRMTDLNTVIREDTAGRASKRKQELELIAEDMNQSEQEDNSRKADAAHKAKVVQQQKAKKRDSKPGYCENCQDKFDDFDEHILSRKHRKFAEKQDNWKELDALLRKLARPPREVEHDVY